jgi:hypothetical protein
MSAPIWYDSTETGAPTINNVNGSVIAALRALLVNGFNVKAITSIVVASGVATVTCPSHGFSSAYGKWLKITGASAPLLDGVKQQTIVDANSFTYLAPGVADGTYTATDARRAPLDWVEEYADGPGTKAIFKRSAAEALLQSLRVVDTGAAPASATSAKVLAVSSPTSVDAYAAQAPLEAQLSGGVFANKGGNTAAAKQWVLIGNDRAMWLFLVEPAATSYVPSIVFFDPKPYRDGDAKATVVSGTGLAASVTTGQSQLWQNSSLVAAPAGGAWAMAASSSVGDPVTVGMVGAGGLGTIGAASYAADPDDFVFHRPCYLKDANVGVRGEVPGMVQPLVSHTVFTGIHSVVQTIDGQRFLVIKFTAFSTSGALAFSLQDDWY